MTVLYDILRKQTFGYNLHNTYINEQIHYHQLAKPVNPVSAEF